METWRSLILQLLTHLFGFFLLTKVTITPTVKTIPWRGTWGKGKGNCSSPTRLQGYSFPLPGWMLKTYRMDKALEPVAVWQNASDLALDSRTVIHQDLWNWTNANQQRLIEEKLQAYFLRNQKPLQFIWGKRKQKWKLSKKKHIYKWANSRK